ncbi:transcriptional regulator MntR [Candidatus Contubernalis alkaliaceticus]|uniref:transcriptional regulator MntR n=1 Tax=Candidatus Contubernalis alkaliaceticus TaxID=338645 RepID=UPI001F4BF45A|nr:transcriptional regulator MntR [Candidatus Contubernalis alkalaceticus]UNC91961.1 transcriptional regulator MntR [Candidatus Contubernalis alkalaceticus]
MKDENEKFYTARGYEITADKDMLTPSMEDYIEMIYRLSQSSGYTRVNDLSEKLNVQPPSVTRMMKKLHEKSLLNYEKYGMIQLTEEGKRMGKFFLDRHNTLKEFFLLLGIEDQVQKEVEQIEHHISWGSFLIINRFVNFLKNRPEIINEFKNI